MLKTIASPASFGLAFLIGMATHVSAADALKPEFPHEHSEIAADPAVTWGKLANGFRYCVMHNEWPKDKVSIRLQVQSGSLLETEPQRGLAHYLEHMAFNGTEHYPPGKIVNFLQDMGLSFGGDTNAHTSYDETVYKLDLPDVQRKTIDTGLEVMADWAGGMLLLPEEVDRERGIILAEMRDRNSPGFRQQMALLANLYPGTLIGQRMPIGLQETVTSATADLMRDYYDRWYRPERMVLAVVGAFKPAEVEEIIKTRFSDLKSRTPAQDDPGIGTLSVEPAKIHCHREPEANGTSVIIAHTRIEPRQHDSIALQKRRLLEGIAAQIVSRRLADLAEKNPTGPMISGQVSSYNWMDLFVSMTDIDVREGQAIGAIAIAEQEVRRFVKFGPTAGELKVAKANTLTSLQQSVERAASRTNASLAATLYSSVQDDSVFTSPTQDLEMLAPWLNEMTAEAVRSTMEQAWASGHFMLMVLGKDDYGADADAKAKSAFEASQQVEVKAPDAGEEKKWAYGEKPEPGPVSSEKLADYDIVQIQCANHVRINLKRTDFKPNEVILQVRMVAPRERKAGISELAGRAFMAGGLGKHSAQDLREVLAGTTASVGGPSIGEDDLVFSGGCSPKDLELCLQRLRAEILDPGWRPEAEAQAKAAWLDEMESLKTNLGAQVSRKFQWESVRGDSNRRLATLEEAKAMTMSEVRAWLEPLLKNSPLTLSVIGDIDVATAKDLALRYFGTLPERQNQEPVADMTVPGVLPTCPDLPAKSFKIDVPGEVARAIIRIGWQTDDYYDVGQTRRLSVLAEVISEKLRDRLREELGEAYSPGCGSWLSEAYDHYGCFIATAGVSPDKAEEANKIMLEIVADLAEKGVPEETFRHAITPILKSLQTTRQQNSYWLGSVMSRAQVQPQRLEWAKSMEADFAGITVDELSALAKKYLINEKAYQVIGVCAGTDKKTEKPATP